MSALKTCSTCKHADQGSGDSVYVWRCLHEKARVENVVDGSADQMQCTKARDFDGPCRKSGNLWELRSE